MKKLIAVLLVSLSLFSLVAGPVIWLGGDFQADWDFSRTHEDDSSLRSIGPGVTVSVFPFFPVKIGGFVSGTILLPISYHSLHGDYRIDLQYGLSYVQLFGNQGFSLLVGMSHSFYQEAEDPDRFPEHQTYRRWNMMGVYADVGYVLQGTEHSYFTFGVGGSYNWKDNNWKLSPHIGGGYIF